MIIVYTAQGNFYEPLKTCINSLLKFNESYIEKIYLIIEDDEIPGLNHPKIQYINLLTCGYPLINNANCSPPFGYMALARCYLTQLLPDIDKIIYLDSDTIVTGSLLEFWNTPMERKAIAGVPESGDYINAGVILLNLKYIRERKEDLVILNLLRCKRFYFPDQDVMNIVFKNEKVLLPEKWNRIGSMDLPTDKNPIIRHFAGVVKPWRSGADPRDVELWNKYKVGGIN